MLTLLLLLFVTVLLYIYLKRPYTYWKQKGVPQWDPRLVLGDLWSTLLKKESTEEFMAKLYNSPEKRYIGLYQFQRPTLYVKDIELIKKIFVKDFDNFVNHRRYVPRGNDLLWDNTVFVLEDEQWREMRSLLSPSFTSSKLKLMYPLVEDCAKNFANYFKNQNSDVIEVEFKEVFSRYGADVIASIALGVEIDSMAEPENELRVGIKEASDARSFFGGLKLIGNLFDSNLYKFLNVRMFNKEVTKFFCDLIDETIRFREENGIVRPDLINLLTEARKAATEGNGLSYPLTNDVIASQAVIYCFAGIGSISSTASFIAYELGKNTDIQSRLREEIQKTYANCGGNLTYEVLLEMQYIDMVISEGMRFWPILPIIERVCTKPYTIEPASPEELPVQVEVGDIIWLPVYNIQKDPKYFPEPYKFNPERFNDENKEKMNPFVHMPFGHGPRKCIGLRLATVEMKLLLFYLLLNFEIVAIEKTKIPLKMGMHLVGIYAEHGLWFGLKKLKQ